MTNKSNLDIQFKDIKNLYQVVPNSSLEYLWSGKDVQHYTIKGLKPKIGGMDLIYKAASMAGGVQHIKATTNDVSISWICREDLSLGNEDIQQCVNRFIWLLYWLEKNDKQFKNYNDGRIDKDALRQFKATLKPLHDYEQRRNVKSYMEFINGYTDNQREHDNSGRLFNMTEYLRLKAMDKGWIFNRQEVNKDGEYCTQLIQDYLSLTIVEKDNNVQLRHWDLYRGVSHDTIWLDDIQTLSNLVGYLYDCYEEGWGTQGQVPPNSEGNLADYLVKEPALAY